MTASKKQIRAEVRANRARRRREILPTLAASMATTEAERLASSWREALSLTGCDLDSPGFLPALFIPTPEEPDVSGILRDFTPALLPVLVTPDGALLGHPAWSLWRGEAASGPFIQPAPRLPAQPSGEPLPPQALGRATVILVAALAVDLTGHRVGQGAGWYDRALRHAAPGVPVIAAVFDEEVLGAEGLPTAAHDWAVDAVITPSRALLVGRETLAQDCADID